MHLPVGVSDFMDLVKHINPLTKQGYLYVDKSLFIQEIIGDSTPVIVLTRPRRFGKTLNLSMLRYFFAAEVEKRCTNGLFSGLKIAKDPICMQEQGKDPVIFITLKDAKYKTFELCLEHIKSQIINLYSEYNFLLNSEQLTFNEKDLFSRFLAKKVDRIELDESIKTLTKFIYKVTGQKSIVLIDEYDTPIQEAYLHGYYDELMSFAKNLLSSALKDNIFLKKAILTGILRISKESLFSVLSNVEIYSILDEKYCQYFGFTDAEVEELLTKVKLPHNAAQTKEWYNGYNFGGTTIYNPWSIIKFIKDEGKKLRSYWVNTSGNELVKNIIIKSSFNIQEKIAELIAGNAIKEYVDEHIVFPDLDQNPNSIWGLLLMSGYLKYVSYQDEDRVCLCELKLPNQEVENFYTAVVKEWLSADRGFTWYSEFLADLREGRIAEFAEKLQTLVEETLSYHDVSKKSQESFYHGMMLGFVSGLKATHTVSSNKESGKGRYDVALIPNDSNKLGIIMEFKAVKNEDKLDAAAIEALAQIKTSKYVTVLKSKGVERICSMGVSFSGKAVKVVSDHS